MENNVITTDDGKTASIISYFTIIGWLIAYFGMHKENRTTLSSFHLRQTLLLNIVALVIGWGFGVIIGILAVSTGILGLVYVTYLFQLAILIIWLVGLIGAINGQRKPMPIIGEKAQTMFPSI